jgi:alcohol dehydrogenase (cytochrome c)
MKSRRMTVVLAAAAVLVVAAAVVVNAVPPLKWRAQVIGLKLQGDLPEVSLLQLIAWMTPLSPVWLGEVPDQKNIPAAIRNINKDKPETLAAGAELFKRTCSHCHGGDAEGGAGPSLLAAVANETDWYFFSSARFGRAGTAMAAQPLKDQEIWDVHSFLRNRARDRTFALATHDVKIDVTQEQLLSSTDHPDSWLMYSGDFLGHRYSKLSQIDNHNVQNLRVAWAAQLRPATRPLSATPIVAGGVVYVTEAPDGVAAIDARTGHLIWRYRRPLDAAKLTLCCAAFNRGLAIYGHTLYLGTLDAHLVAVDARTGLLQWDVKVADPKDGFSMTNAPLIVDGYVMVGVAGGEFGMRGFVAAYAAADGRKLWHLETIPGPGEPGHESWAGDSWKTGGAPTWITGVYDAPRDIVYWTTGNPWPDLDDRNRKGDNLYSNCMLAIERKTGKLLWHFQYTPADVHDWDASQQPQLTDITWKGVSTPVVLLANRNGFYYALDRRDGTFLFAKQFVKQTWNKGFTAKGRPIVDPAANPSREGTMVWPWMHGGANWWPPSFDPVRRLHFVPTVDAATIYFAVDMTAKAGTMTMGGTTHLADTQPAIMAVKAIDPETGAIRWTTRLDRDNLHQYSRVSGTVATAGGLVFAGFEDRLVALDSDDGRILWDFQPGGNANAAPVTYEVDGRQYITVLAGSVLFSFGLPPSGRESEHFGPQMTSTR